MENLNTLVNALVTIDTYSRSEDAAEKFALLDVTNQLRTGQQLLGQLANTAPLGDVVRALHELRNHERTIAYNKIKLLKGTGMLNASFQETITYEIETKLCSAMASIADAESIHADIMQKYNAVYANAQNAYAVLTDAGHMIDAMVPHLTLGKILKDSGSLFFLKRTLNQICDASEVLTNGEVIIKHDYAVERFCEIMRILGLVNIRKDATEDTTTISRVETPDFDSSTILGVTKPDMVKYLHNLVRDLK